MAWEKLANDSFSPVRPTALLDASRESNQRLLGNLALLTERERRQPSALPRYSRGHVIVHLTNKARAHRHVLGGPVVAEVRRLHPPGYDPDAAAEAGAHRPIAELLADLSEALSDLEAAWDELDDGHWTRTGMMMAGPRTMAEIVGHHLRNVEVHHVDLDIGYGPADWPDAFVNIELAKRIADLPSRADHRELLAWLLERAPAPFIEPW